MPKIMWLTGLVVFLTASSAHAGDYVSVVAVPEPMTLTLLGAGAGVVAVAEWWRRRK